MPVTLLKCDGSVKKKGKDLESLREHILDWFREAKPPVGEARKTLDTVVHLLVACTAQGRAQKA